MSDNWRKQSRNNSSSKHQNSNTSLNEFKQNDNTPNQVKVRNLFEQYKKSDHYNDQIKEKEMNIENKHDIWQNCEKPDQIPLIRYKQIVNDPSTFHVGCSELLLALDSLSKQYGTKLMNSYRIEINAITENCSEFQLSLRLNPSRWYLDYLKVTNLSQSIDIARQYIQDIRSKKYELPSYFTDDRTPSPKTTIHRDYCEFQGSCRYLPKCNKYHASHVCPQRVQKKDGIDHCEWWTTDDFVCIENEQYIVQVKKGDTRELLMFPKPPHHESNRILCQQALFWKNMVENINTMCNSVGYTEFPAFGFAFNFGEWESSMSQDPMAINCHGHLHIFLKSSFLDQCELKNQYFAIHQRYGNPETYREHDIFELESKCLLGDENLDIRTQYKTINEKYKTINEKLDQLLSKK